MSALIKKLVRASTSILFISLLSGCIAHPSSSTISSYQPSIALDQPLPANTVLNWAQEAVLTAYNYSYENYDQYLQSSSHYFTPAGWKAHSMAMQESENPKAVLQYQQTVSAQLINPPVLLEQNLIGNTYTWKVQAPLQVTYQSKYASRAEYISAILLITRTLPSEGVRGLAIQQFLAVKTNGKNAAETPHVIVTKPALITGMNRTNFNADQTKPCDCSSPTCTCSAVTSD